MSCEPQQEFENFGRRARPEFCAIRDANPSDCASSALIASSERRRRVLASVFEGDVIPHMLRRSSANEVEQNLSVERLASLCVRSNTTAVVAAILSIYHLPTDIDQILLDLLTPSARLLGAWWADDLCTFADVTMGVGNLRTTMNILTSRLADESVDSHRRGPRTLLMPLPGEQHSFGVSMLATFFSRTGWNTRIDTANDLQELHRIVSVEQADMVGFSVSHVDMFEAARNAIAVVRAATSNPKLVVMVGGLPFTDDPFLAEAVGADGTATDGAQAVIKAFELIGRR